MKVDEIDNNKVIEVLIQLQEINQELDVLKKEIIELEEETNVDSKKLESRQELMNVQEEKVKNLTIEFDEISLDIKVIKDKQKELAKKKKQVKTIKEFNAINNEIDDLNRKNALRENELLSKKEKVELYQSKLDNLQQQRDDILEKLDEKKSQLNDLIAERKTAIKKIEKEKAKIEKKVDENILEKFNRIYVNQDRKAIVPITDKICTGCYVQLPMQVEIDVKKNKTLILCPSCSRILYYKEEEETPLI